MLKSIPINVYEIVGSEYCVASDDGQKIFDQIVEIIKNEHRAVLSFKNVTSITSAFLNSAIGQLYGKFQKEEIKKYLAVEDMENDDRLLLKRVVETAKEYFKDPDRFNQTIRDVLDEGNE